MDIAEIRRQIPATERSLYFNSGWSGPSPQPVLDAVIRNLEHQNFEGPTLPHVLLEERETKERTRQAIAEFMGADPEEISIRQNTTDGLNVVLNGLSFAQGDHIVSCNLEHSSGVVPLYYLRERHGVDLSFVKLTSEDSPQQIVDKIEAAMTPKTRLILVSHISYSFGIKLPLLEINELAHTYGAYVLVDAAQSAGHIALDMHALDCDFYAMTGHKWIMGPDGMGGLYIRRSLIEALEPANVAGRAAEHYDFEGDFTPRRDDIHKFELTTTSGPIAAGLTAAIEFQRASGRGAIEERINQLATLARRRLADLPDVRLASPEDGPTTCGLVCFSLDGMAPEDVVKQLWEQGRIVARQVRESDSTRLSIHYFNSENEIEAVASLLSELSSEAR